LCASFQRRRAACLRSSSVSWVGLAERNHEVLAASQLANLLPLQVEDRVRRCSWVEIACAQLAFLVSAPRPGDSLRVHGYTEGMAHFQLLDFVRNYQNFLGLLVGSENARAPKEQLPKFVNSA